MLANSMYSACPAAGANMISLITTGPDPRQRVGCAGRVGAQFREIELSIGALEQAERLLAFRGGKSTESRNRITLVPDICSRKTWSPNSLKAKPARPLKAR